ncbi:MAG: Rpn family recombination-promoting nuclease/putative transposase [Bacteroidales bacterium]|nr:Rpn family recombination-promoting nuclease/putative transposase [Bacteroidales bacterium]
MANKVKTKEEMLAQINAKYGNVMVDFIFKRLFGNKLIMLPFLKMVIPDEDIVDIDYLPTENLGDTIADNKVIFDISCTTSDGRVFIAEMQKANQVNFKNRSIAYVSSHISSQARTHREKNNLNPQYKWNYDLRPVYLIAIMNFSFEHRKDFPTEKYICCYQLRESETHELLNNIVNFTYIEMKRFKKTEEECITLLDKLTYSLKHMHELTAPPSFFNEKFFNDLYKLAELNNFTAEELRNYMKRLFAVSDYENSIDFAKEESRTEERLKNAKNLKALGVDLDIIAQGLGLDRKTVEEL